MQSAMKDTSFASIKSRLQSTADVDAPQRGIVVGFVLVAAGDAATAVLREGGSGGVIIASLKAGAGLSDKITTDISYSGQLHVTITGTTPEVFTYIK